MGLRRGKGKLYTGLTTYCHAFQVRVVSEESRLRTPLGCSVSSAPVRSQHDECELYMQGSCAVTHLRVCWLLFPKCIRSLSPQNQIDLGALTVGLD